MCVQKASQTEALRVRLMWYTLVPKVILVTLVMALTLKYQDSLSVNHCGQLLVSSKAGMDAWSSVRPSVIVFPWISFWRSHRKEHHYSVANKGNISFARKETLQRPPRSTLRMLSAIVSMFSSAPSHHTCSDVVKKWLRLAAYGVPILDTAFIRIVYVLRTLLTLRASWLSWNKNYRSLAGY